jgi:hypothetical protein
MGEKNSSRLLRMTVLRVRLRGRKQCRVRGLRLGGEIVVLMKVVQDRRRITELPDDGVVCAASEFESPQAIVSSRQASALYLSSSKAQRNASSASP